MLQQSTCFFWTYPIAPDSPLNREGMRLDGVRLEGPQLEKFKDMVKQSFVPGPPRTRTPLSSPDEVPSRETPNDASAWTVHPDDLRPASPALIDKGMSSLSNLLHSLLTYLSRRSQVAFR